MKIAVIDNYDSFTYNLVQILRAQKSCQVDVFRNDQYQLAQLENYHILVLSPGPGLPSQAGKLMETIKRFWETKSILGVCLGHQAICEFFGAKLRCLDTVFHGLSSEIKIDLNSPYFESLPARINVGRYHSWVVDPDSLTKPLLPIATDYSGEIMAVSHEVKPILGLQFHPESIMTKYGKQIIHQFINSSCKQKQYYERTEQIYT